MKISSVYLEYFICNTDVSIAYCTNCNSKVSVARANFSTPNNMTYRKNSCVEIPFLKGMK